MKLAKVSLIGLAAVVFLGTVPILGTASAANRSWSCYKHKESEQRFNKKMNRARRNHGLEGMKLDKQLGRIARRHSEKMAADSAIYHSSVKGLSEKITRWRSFSENVGRGGSVTTIHRGFMGSSGHRANILTSKWRHVGVGVVKKSGLIYVSVIFESRRDPGTTLRAPAC